MERLLVEIKLNKDKLQSIALFERLTGVAPKDCIKSGDGSRLTFVVDEQDMGKAIGENGRNIQKVREKVNKVVHVVEYFSDPEEFLKNIFSPVEVKSIELNEKAGKKTARIKVDESEKGRAVGKNGWNIERARKLSNRHHGLNDVVFE
ncbi:hypothetical protein AKJ50_00365 [candidate division MSBL1 archaeon SCGC-AAA382A13]|uniref:Probable transcription termination protein NusA n=1 Tax=candidate division MSBL1 archaeon SCGC-AAA382A13 TaxID=1698279 RepID=A0A133VGS6_9EURY|nr:hypothetical protein AKJ50_00365 [candidate division MSBL1 archaeon SCGC-AAA382A13]